MQNFGIPVCRQAGASLINYLENVAQQLLNFKF